MRRIEKSWHGRPAISNALLLLLALAASGTFSITNAVAAKTAKCGSVLIVGSDAEGERTESGGANVRATAVSCKRARSVVRECIRRGRVKGWVIVETSVPVRGSDFRQTRLVLTRGRATVSFAPAGGGSCSA